MSVISDLYRPPSWTPTLEMARSVPSRDMRGSLLTWNTLIITDIMTQMTDLDAAGCEDPVPLLPEHDTGPGPGLTQLGHRAVQPQCGANLDL